MTTWDILICSIEHRTDMLAELLGELERQKVPGLGVRVFRDNLQTGYGEKCQRLLDSSDAEYVSFLDDDDWVADDFVEAIMGALEEKPDYVGFQVRYTVDGVYRMPVYHTLDVDGWIDGPEALYRDINHFNPIRRDLATKSFWEGGDGADRRWAARLREQGCVKTQVFIDREMHHYRHRPSYTFTVCSVQAPMEDGPPAPEAPWVTWLT